MDNQKAKMLGENLAHYKRMQENGTVDIIEFHTTDGQKFGIGNVAAIQLLLSVTVTELERQLHTARFGGIPERLEESRNPSLFSQDIGTGFLQSDESMHHRYGKT